MISTLDIFLNMLSTTRNFLVLIYYDKCWRKGTMFCFLYWTLFPDYILPLERLLTDVKAKCFGERFHLLMSSVCRPTMGIRLKTFYTCQLKNALYFFLREVRNIFHESAIYLGCITTKLSISKSCVKNHRLFTFDKMTFLWWWENGYDFLRSPFVLWCFQEG